MPRSKKGKGTQRETIASPGAVAPVAPGVQNVRIVPGKSEKAEGAAIADPEDVKTGHGKSARGSVKATRVRVVATRTGYYGHRRRHVDEVFDMFLRDGGKLPSWVESVASREAIKSEGMSVDLEEEGYPGFVSVATPRFPSQKDFDPEVV